MKLSPQIIKLIKERMTSFGMERKNQLANATGISEPTIGRILSGSVDSISDHVAEKLAVFLGLSIEQLVIVAMGHTPKYKKGMNEYAVHAISRPDIKRLCHWLEKESNELPRRVIFATAGSLGFK